MVRPFPLPSLVVSANNDAQQRISPLESFKATDMAVSRHSWFNLMVQRKQKSNPRNRLRSVPPWAVAFGFCMLIATASDWAKHRFAFTMGSICVAIVGFGILISVTDNTSLQYGALFLVTSGTYTAMPLVVCHAISNFGNHTRRAVGSGFIIGYGNVGVKFARSP